MFALTEGRPRPKAGRPDTRVESGWPGHRPQAASGDLYQNAQLPGSLGKSGREPFTLCITQTRRNKIKRGCSQLAGCFHPPLLCLMPETAGRRGGKQGLEVNRTELETVLSGGLVLAAGGRWERWGDPQCRRPPHLLRTAMLVMFHALPYQRMKAELISLFKVSADITGD